jgi:hypothetical protein
MAAVAVNIVHIAKDAFTSPFELDGKVVRYISSQLDEQKLIGEPYLLAANREKSFQGSVIVGIGFVLEPEEAEWLLAKDERIRDVVLPYLNAEDLNSNPDQSPSRYIINFFNWPRERIRPGSWYALNEQAQKQVERDGVVPADYPGRVAADYAGAYQIVKERVYPLRQTVNREAHKKYWWHYGDKRPLLYSTIAPLQRVLVVPRVTKYCSFMFVDKNLVYADRMYVFAFSDFATFAILQSSVHECWARQYSSTLETRLNYAATDAFETFPLLHHRGDLSTKGDWYYEHRRAIMLDRWEGLTATYNRFHNPDESAEDIARLRQLHVEMDNAVAAAYGWQDIDLGHGFHETPQGIRYTIAEPARRTVLTRLLELNHARYAEEVKAGLHDKKKGKGKSKRKDDAAGSQLEMW